MKLTTTTTTREQGSIAAYLVTALVILSAIASVSTLVIQNVKTSHRRSDMVAAHHFAEGGAGIAVREFETAFTNSTGTLTNNLLALGYARNNTLSSPKTNVFERTITAPFSNQAVTARIYLTNSPNPVRAEVVALAQVGQVTQSSLALLSMTVNYPGAIISDHKGDNSNGVDKNTGQKGNVVLDGVDGGWVVVDGAILANGRVNVKKSTTGPIFEKLWGTEDEIPDYTNPGSDMQLFDFNRFIAVAKASGNYYSNLASFVTVAKTKSAANPFQGVVAVNIKTGEDKLEEKDVPGGVHVRGTLLFSFASGWKADDKLVNTAGMYINAADLTGLNRNDPTTFKTGYPPVFTDPSKNPVNVDISGLGFQNFQVGDDLPAFMYNNAIFDIHGPANVCGAVFSPAFMEIENKNSPQIQYFKGVLIGGGGVYVEGKSRSLSIFSYDPNTVDKLATVDAVGRSIKVVHWK